MDCRTINQHAIVKDILSSMKNGKTIKLTELLEILNTTTDVDGQVRLFSVLSAYAMLNDDNIEAIVTNNLLYNKICKIIESCPPRKATVAFNFLSALLYVDDEGNHRKSSLAAYARNMIRSSGCLAVMCDLFTTCMMHQDAWRALCRCLAESCRGFEANQSYCTHLVPMCIQRCSQRNIEVLLVLQSLLQNHNRNVTLFVQCKGISLFQRELLQHDSCLQLLASIVQCSTEAVALIVDKTDICQLLRDFLHLYGPQSQLGQWATIVLYHTSRAESKINLLDNNGKVLVMDQLASSPLLTPRQDQQVTEGNKDNIKLSESLVAKLHPVDKKQKKDCSVDTTKFFQNVMKEIVRCGAQKEFKDLKTFPTDSITNRSQRNVVKTPFHDITQKKEFWMTSRNPNKFYARRAKPIANVRLDFNKSNELSLSFLRNQHFNKKHVTTNFSATERLPESFQRTLQTNECREQKSVYDSFENNESHLHTVCTNDFKPHFASTPKTLHNYSRYTKQYPVNNTVRSIEKSIRNHQIKRRLQKKMVKHLERSKIEKEIKHKSFSGRFFDAINTSCTTLVKTVKNIFRPKIDMDETRDGTMNKTTGQDTMFCSYSFTKYMQRRDDALKNVSINKSKEKFEDTHERYSMETDNSCNTCNDTITLKRKLVNDDNLKQTIRKLKLGINLYGCNFKKISRTMWPNESYMTPAVLYNLYRKLIIK